MPSFDSALSPLIRSILDVAVDAAIITDDNGRVLEWNQQAVDTFGWSRSEALGQDMESLIIPEEYRAPYRRGMEQFRETRTGPVLKSPHRLTAIRKSGEEFLIELSTSAVETLLVGFVREMTKWIAVEQQLARQTLESTLLQQATTLTTESDSFDEALQTTLDILCEATGWPVGHVYIVDESGERLTSSRIWHIEDAQTFHEFRRVTEATSIARGEGFSGRIWASGRAEWTSDIAIDTNAARRGLSSDLQVHGAFGFPVKIDEEIVAVMEFFSGEEVTPDPQLLRMVNNIGGQLGRMMERRRLQEEQTRQAAIVNSTSDAIISRSLDGAITSWNDGAERLFGYTAEEALAGGIELILPEKAADEDAGIMDAVRAGRRVDRVETLRQHRNGSQVSVSVTVSPMVDIDGRIIGASTIERDISELIETRHELQESEEHARLLLESAAEAIYGIDLDGNCTFCNRSCVAMLGYSSATELLGRNMHDVMHHTRSDGSALPRDECEIHRAVRNQQGCHVDSEILWRKDGSSFPAEYWSYPVIRHDEVVGAVVTFLDITDRRMAEEGQARLASVVNSSADAIIATDPEAVIIHWNHGAEQVYGYTESEAVGRSLSFILPPGIRPEDSVVLAAIRDGKELMQFETVRKRSDQTIINVSITVSPIRTPDDRLVGASSIERDTTSRNRREKELELARDAAEAANRTKSEFLANISHELRTPMNSIIGMTDLALREQLSSDVRDYLVTARDSADTLLFLLNDVLDFSRMEADRFELEPVSFNLRGMLQDTIRSLSLRAHERGLELACQIAPDVPYWVRGDSLRLRQIMTNLVTNALKFTEQGEVLVKVGRDDAAGDLAVGTQFQLHVAVIDTGIGISKEDLQRIFSPFTQADASTTRRYQGTGLGLSICQRLTSLMDGRMWVDSKPGEGSTFHFSIRLAVAAEGDGEVSRERLTARQLRSMPVLVVDDNQTNRRILVEILQNWSMRPTACADAKAAMDELVAAAERETPYPLVIVDALMPQNDGFGLIERIHADPRLKRATILMLSSADRQVFRQRCSTLPISTFLEKPVSQSDLLDSIMTALDGPQFVSRAAETQAPTDRPLSILVAEDTPANQKVITRILTKRGHHVDIAHNGREAVDRTQREEFDIVIMDVQMPTMDGLQATSAIRKRESTSGRHLPVVAMTAHALRGDREKCLKAGMDAYLPKPIDADRLIRLIESIVPGRIPSKSTETMRVAAAAEPAHAEPAAVQTAGNDPVWNEAAALERLGHDPELLSDMIDYFAEDSVQLIERIQSAVASTDTEELTRAAHSLKGLCSNFEAGPASEVALAVQTLAESGETAEAAEQLPELTRQVTRLREQLALWQTEHNGSPPDS